MLLLALTQQQQQQQQQRRQLEYEQLVASAGGLDSSKVAAVQS
jgi:hypothetical protein